MANIIEKARAAVPFPLKRSWSEPARRAVRAAGAGGKVSWCEMAAEGVTASTLASLVKHGMLERIAADDDSKAWSLTKAGREEIGLQG